MREHYASGRYRTHDKNYNGHGRYYNPRSMDIKAKIFGRFSIMLKDKGFMFHGNRYGQHLEYNPPIYNSIVFLIILNLKRWFGRFGRSVFEDEELLEDTIIKRENT